MRDKFLDIVLTVPDIVDPLFRGATCSSYNEDSITECNFSDGLRVKYAEYENLT